MNDLIRADVLLCGGLTSLLTASALADAGMHVAVLYARSTPPCGCAHLLCTAAFQRIADVHGHPTAAQYASALQDQLHALFAASLPYAEPMPVYLYARTEAELPLLDTSRTLLTQLDVPFRTAPDAGGCPFPVALSLTMPGVSLDIPRWAAALRRSIRHHGGRILSGDKSVSVASNRYHTGQHIIEAPLIVFTDGLPVGTVDRRLLSRLESRLIACTHLTGSPLHTGQFPVQEGGVILVPARRELIAAVDTGHLGTKAIIPAEPMLLRRLPDYTADTFQYRPEVRALDGLPLIGALPFSNHLIAVGHAPTGIPGMLHAAEVLCRRILGSTQPTDNLYRPDRPLPRAFLRQLWKQRLQLRARDLLRHSRPSCPHCGTRMCYTIAAHLWGCPGCGSAFDMFGQVLFGPSAQPAQVSVRQRPDL